MLPKIFYINLDCATKRRKNMEKQLNDFGLNYERVCAVNGKIKTDLTKKIKIPKDSKQTKCELACTASHLVAIKKAFKQNLFDAIILEDDAIITPLAKSPEKLISLLREVPEDCEILQLVTSSMHIKTLIELKEKVIPWATHCYGTCGYYITRKGMHKLLTQCYSNKRIKFPQMTNYVADIVLYELCKTYTCTKPLISFSAEDSFVHDNHLVQHRFIKNIVDTYLSTN